MIGYNVGSMVADPKDTEKKLKAIFSDVKERLENGYERWLDEKDYEDINDYAILFRAKVESGGGKFRKMTKRPFGFIAEINGFDYQFYANAKMVGARGVK